MLIFKWEVNFVLMWDSNINLGAIFYFVYLDLPPSLSDLQLEARVCVCVEIRIFMVLKLTFLVL